ncbi:MULTISPECIES: hypothetical protein [unclassified Streptomyces]|uniref:hypothetical protein n=1 Tax=unclassified Streptomyces TaxID=2593676 RepID=UPI00365FDB2E
MNRNFHSVVSKTGVRVVFAAGAALLIAGSPMMSGSAFAEERNTPGVHSAAAVGERPSDAVAHLLSAIQENVLPLLPVQVNGWQ